MVYSCYTDEELKKIAEKIDVSGEERTELIAAIDAHMSAIQCENELCWAEFSKVKLPGVHMPVRTWGRDRWLSDSDIDAVTKIYSNHYNHGQKYSKHLVLYSVPMDAWYYADKIVLPSWNEILKAHYMYIPICLNGFIHRNHIIQHWVALVVHMNRGAPESPIDVFYFDPLAYHMPPPMEKFKAIFLLGLKLASGRKVIYNENTIAIQKTDGDCGIFVLDLICRMMEGEQLQDILDRYTDHENHRIMTERMRDSYFN